MRATIWIRQENEDAWNKSGKGVWVNSMLDAQATEKLPPLDNYIQLGSPQVNSGLSSNGRTSGLGPENLGSNPNEPAKNEDT